MRVVELPESAELNSLAMSIAAWSRSVVMQIGRFGLVIDSWRLTEKLF